MEEFEIHKCKNCGGELDYSKAVSGVVKCEFCMSVYTVPKGDSKAKSYLDMGMHGLDTCNFDDAYTAYQKAAEIDKKEPEAYFGMALATAQVQYLKDYVNNRMQPIVHAVTEKSFLQDKNFKKALEYATSEQTKEYTAKANEIDSIRRQFFDLKKSGVKYDCFICVKVTEEGGRHTEDSHIASKLYHDLQEAGYSPFYSEEEIKGRTGADYEALILYALHNSPSMLLVCTDESYLQTPWVKNEYTRYLNMLNQEEKHRDSLTIVFTENIIERLPGVSGKIQGVPFKTYDALPRIIEFVDRFVQRSAPEISRKEYGKTTYKKKNVIKQGITKRKLTEVGQGEITVSDKAKLAIASDFLKRKDFENTIRFCNNLVAENPSNSEAYWLTFLAENKCNNDDTLLQNSRPIKDFNNYEKAVASCVDKAQIAYLNRLLFERIKVHSHISEYQEFIELPDSSEKDISTLTQSMFEKVLKSKNKDEDIFNIIIKTVTDTDVYISMNLQFAKAIDRLKAVKYYDNILQVDEGHHEALWQSFFAQHNFDNKDIFVFCSDVQNHSNVEDKLFAYGYNELALKNLFNICFDNVNEDAEKSCKVFDFLLSLIPKEKETFYSHCLNTFIELMLKAKQPSLVSRYNDLLISVDKYDYNAYFTRCLVNHGHYNPLSLVRHVDNLLNDVDYFTAVNSYTEKHPTGKNLYLDLYYELEKYSKEFADYPECLDYLVDEYYIQVDVIIGEKQRLYDELNAMAEAILKDTLSKYGCSDYNQIFELRRDVSQDPGWQLAYNFARVGKNNELAEQIHDIIIRQSKSSKNNIKSDNGKRLYKATVAFSVICALSMILTLIMAMAGVPRISEFWLVIFQANKAALYAVGILFIIIPNIALLVYMFLRIKEKESALLPMIAIFIFTAICMGVGIGQWNSAKAEKSSYYIGDRYVLKLSNSNGTYSIDRYEGFCQDIVLPATYNGKSITAIKDNAFYGRHTLRSVKFESGSKLQNIGNEAFYWCDNLISIDLPNSLTKIDARAFESCYKLSRIEIPSSVTSIGSAAFFGCSSLTGVYITDIASWCAIEFEDNFANPLIYGKKLYLNNKLVTTLKIPGGVKSIGDYAFYRCSSLRSVEILSGVTSIGDSAFNLCDNLNSIIIPISVTSINDSIFYECNNLTIYCEASGKPNGWSRDWNYYGRPVVWGYSGN